MYTVVLSDHAKRRLRERVVTAGRKTLSAARHEIETRLVAALRLGVVPGPDLGVTVYLSDGYKAICYPTFEGVWLVATVLEPEMEVVEKAAGRSEEAVV